MAAARREGEFAGENEATATASSTSVKRRKREEKEEEVGDEESRIIKNGGGETSGVASHRFRSRDSLGREDDDNAFVSYSSGNGFVDLVEDDNMAQTETSKIYKCKNTRDSDKIEIQTTKKVESKKKRCIKVKEGEVEEFFTATNKDLLIKFSKKYNFDFENEEALDGRYEWVKSKP